MDEHAEPISDKPYEEVDIFAWANNLLEYKEELAIDLFLISKSYVPYKAAISKDLHGQLEILLIDKLLEYIFDGAEMGMTVRGFEKAESEEGVLQRTQVYKVEKAREMLNWIETQEHELETFNEEEHDFGRIKGIVARIRHSRLKTPCYVVKVLPKSNVVPARGGWILRDGKFVKFDAEAAVRIPADNQLLIIDKDLFVFSQPRLKQMFGYDAKDASIAEKKVQEILANFRLSFPEGLTIQSLVAGKKSTIKKLQTVEPTKVTQEQLLHHAEEIDIEMMEDDSGAIIIMDGKDLDTFVNLLNDDYLESPLTGERYEIVKKRPIKVRQDDAADGI